MVGLAETVRAALSQLRFVRRCCVIGCDLTATIDTLELAESDCVNAPALASETVKDALSFLDACISWESVNGFPESVTRIKIAGTILHSVLEA